ncbi:hypothetical protein DFH28DRAFT_1118821 [Melampsora americana]|nr:hypothetical protein DFH28DRAFT_1118821 [Melampsora americana]
MVTGKPAFWTDYNSSHKGTTIYKKKYILLYALMNKLLGDVNATSDGSIGSQTASHTVTHPAFHSPTNNLSSDDLPEIDLMAENKPMESQQIKKEPIEKKPEE